MKSWMDVPLVLVLTGVLCSPAQGGTLLQVNNTQDVYQKEEHSNFTLTLSAVNTISDFLSIELRRVETRRTIYRYHSRSQPVPYVDDLFKDRLQCDTQLDRSGQIECVLTDLRINDTGSYQGIVKDGGPGYLKKWELKVKASIRPNQEGALKHQTPEETSKLTPRERLWILIPSSLFLLAVALLVFFAICYKKKIHSETFPSDQKLVTLPSPPSSLSVKPSSHCCKKKKQFRV